MIKGLLKKDLYNLASYKASLIIIVLFCGIAIVGTEAINWGSIIICTIIGMIALLGGILGLLLTIIVTNVMNYIRPENMININYESLITTTIGGMFGISLIQAIQIPSIFKWGAEKGRIQMFILLFIIIVITAGAGFLIMKANLNINMEMLENFINQFGLVLLVVLMIIMYSISYVISYRIYKNKEE